MGNTSAFCSQPYLVRRVIVCIPHQSDIACVKFMPPQKPFAIVDRNFTLHRCVSWVQCLDSRLEPEMTAKRLKTVAQIKAPIESHSCPESAPVGEREHGDRPVEPNLL